MERPDTDTRVRIASVEIDLDGQDEVGPQLAGSDPTGRFTNPQNAVTERGVCCALIQKRRRLGFGLDRQESGKQRGDQQTMTPM
jgi:hypothetical protein